MNTPVDDPDKTQALIDTPDPQKEVIDRKRDRSINIENKKARTVMQFIREFAILTADFGISIASFVAGLAFLVMLAWYELIPVHWLFAAAMVLTVGGMISNFWLLHVKQTNQKKDDIETALIGSQNETIQQLLKQINRPR